MRPLFLTPLAALLLASPAAAQIPVTTASGVGSFGGGFRPGTPALMAPVPLRGSFFPGNQFFPGRRFIGGGFAPVYPFAPYTSFYGGGFLSGGYYYPYYQLPPTPIFDEPPPPPPAPPSRIVELSGESKGSVTLQLPHAAKVWLDGRELEGGPAREWVLSSPVLRPDEQYTLNVVARWEADGKTYESTNKVTVGPGDRSRLAVISGTAVK